MTASIPQLLSPGVNVLLDGQWGSTGKGKLSAYLSANSDVVWNTADFQPNAGHTVVIGGRAYVTKTIPSGFVNRDAKLYLSPASTINVETLLKEIELLDDFGVENRLSIHPLAGVVTPEDIEEERQSMRTIASTMTGGGAALRRKIGRQAKTARDVPELRRWINDRTLEIIEVARVGGIVLAESAQGFDLSLNHGWSYPYTTSRDVTTASVLANLGAPPQLLSRVWASMRTFPIRVGHLMSENGAKEGDSGPFYPDQRELTWEEMTQMSGSQKALLERTTVTKRVRRIFTWSETQYQRFLAICQPTDVFLNFANYLDNSISLGSGRIHYRQVASLWPKVAEHVEMMMAQATNKRCLSPMVRLLGVGPAQEEMVHVTY